VAVRAWIYGVGWPQHSPPDTARTCNSDKPTACRASHVPELAHARPATSHRDMCGKVADTSRPRPGSAPQIRSTSSQCDRRAATTTVPLQDVGAHVLSIRRHLYSLTQAGSAFELRGRVTQRGSGYYRQCGPDQRACTHSGDIGTRARLRAPSAPARYAACSARRTYATGPLPLSGE
jgi:hypothetical protein